MKYVAILLLAMLSILNLSCVTQPEEENKEPEPDPPGTPIFTNPIMEEGADPWVYKHTDGYYYYMATRGNRLNLWRSDFLPNISNGEQKTIWTPPPSGPNSSNIWAPEIHYVNDKWYIYYTAVDKEEPTDTNRKVFVLENNSANPLQGEWVEKGAVNSQYSGLDGSVFEVNDRWYYVYSAYTEGESVISISRMENPWTLEGEENIIARPTYGWEAHEGRAICEAPQPLKGKDGKLIIVYSASACWDDYYTLGMLVASDTSDLTDPDSWEKLPEPVFQTSEENSVYGPGHCSFTTMGNTSWIVYHAKQEANGVCSGRSTRMQPFTWTEDGLPDFGTPIPLNEKITIPNSD